ncbi:hypothetical protein [Hyella patelloides]|nr:hypothetical protein [Hyella patelloides]
MKEINIFQPLIGQTIVSLQRLIVLGNDYTENGYYESDTLIFVLSNDSCFETLVTSEYTVLKKITGKQDFIINFPLESNETIDTVLISEKIELPFTVASIIEIWAGESDSFLVAVDFLNKNKKSYFSILTETDEINILKSQALKPIINKMIFDYRFISHKWYAY